MTAIDIWFEGKERNQIPMFALTVTKPYRLIDAIYAGNFYRLRQVLKFYIYHKSSQLS